MPYLDLHFLSQGRGCDGGEAPCSASSSISKCVSLGQDTEAARTYRIQQRWSGGECGEQQKWGAAPELLSLPGQAGKGAINTGIRLHHGSGPTHLSPLSSPGDSNLLSVSQDWPTLTYHAMRLYHMGSLAGCLLSILVMFPSFRHVEGSMRPLILLADTIISVVQIDHFRPVEGSLFIPGSWLASPWSLCEPGSSMRMTCFLS